MVISPWGADQKCITKVFVVGFSKEKKETEKKKLSSTPALRHLSQFAPTKMKVISGKISFEKGPTGQNKEKRIS